MIVATPTQQKILADFAGVEAHAGIRPEDGSSAIAAAAAAISRGWSWGGSTRRRPPTSA